MAFVANRYGRGLVRDGFLGCWVYGGQSIGEWIELAIGCTVLISKVGRPLFADKAHSESDAVGSLPVGVVGSRAVI